MHHIAAAEAAHSIHRIVDQNENLAKNQRRSSPCWMSSSFNSTSRPRPGRRGGGIRCLLPQCGISRSCAAPAGVVRWMNHSGAAAGDHKNEGRRQREEQPGRFAPTRRPCSLASSRTRPDGTSGDGSLEEP